MEEKTFIKGDVTYSKRYVTFRGITGEGMDCIIAKEVTKMATSFPKNTKKDYFLK